MKLWFYILIGFFALAIIGSNLHRYVPGQEDEPALAKASLCDLASDVHNSMIRASKESGLVRAAGPGENELYILEVDEAIWAEQPVESRELLAIAAWCRVAGDDGRGVAVIVGADRQNELASVVKGVFTEREGAVD